MKMGWCNYIVIHGLSIAIEIPRSVEYDEDCAKYLVEQIERLEDEVLDLDKPYSKFSVRDLGKILDRSNLIEYGVHWNIFIYMLQKFFPELEVMNEFEFQEKYKEYKIIR